MIRLFKPAQPAVTRVLLAGMILWGCTTLSIAGMLGGQTLRYAVSEGNMAIGELEVIIGHDDGQIKTTVITHLAGLAKILLEDYTAETWFHLDEGHAILDRGRLRTQGGNKGLGFMVDYPNKTLQLDSGDTYPITSGEILDSTEFPIALITADIASVAGKIVWEVNARKARRYIYHAPKPDMFELNGRSYNTWKVTRTKQGDIHRTVTYWLDPGRQNIPLKIITIKKDRETILTLLD